MPAATAPIALRACTLIRPHSMSFTAAVPTAEPSTGCAGTTRVLGSMSSGRCGPSAWCRATPERTDSAGCKRRSVIDAGEVSRIAGAADGDWSGGWFQRRLRARHLGPVCSISYLRTAMVGQQLDGSLVRLTLDEELCAARVQAPAFGQPHSGIRLAGGDQILELKFLGEMPVLFKELLESFTLTRSSVSKYRIAATALGMAARRNEESARRDT